MMRLEQAVQIMSPQVKLDRALSNLTAAFQFLKWASRNMERDFLQGIIAVSLRCNSPVEVKGKHERCNGQDTGIFFQVRVHNGKNFQVHWSQAHLNTARRNKGISFSRTCSVYMTMYQSIYLMIIALLKLKSKMKPLGLLRQRETE